MRRPHIVDLLLEDFGGDAEPIEKYIVDLEQECYQLKEDTKDLYRRLGLKYKPPVDYVRKTQENGNDKEN